MLPQPEVEPQKQPTEEQAKEEPKEEPDGKAGERGRSAVASLS